MNRQIGARHAGRHNGNAQIVPNGKRKLTDGTVIESITFLSRGEKAVAQGTVTGTAPNGSRFQITVPLKSIVGI